MTNEVDVLCDVHHERMNPRGYVFASGLGDIWTRYYACCSVAGCCRHFTPLKGYIDMRDRRIDLSRRVKNHCLAGHGSMAIVAVSSEGVRWECLHADFHEMVRAQ